MFSSVSDPLLYPGSRFLAELESGPGHGKPGRDLAALLSTLRAARSLLFFTGARLARSEALIWDNLALCWWLWELSVLQCTSPDAWFLKLSYSSQ